MAYPVSKGYSTATGSHVWQSCCVHVKGAHVEVSNAFASSSYRSAELFQLTTGFFSLTNLLFLVPHLLS